MNSLLLLLSNLTLCAVLAGEPSAQGDAARADHIPGPQIRAEAPEPVAPAPLLSCRASGKMSVVIRNADGRQLGGAVAVKDCERIIQAAGDGVVCAYLGPGARLGADNHGGTGWRPMSIQGELGLGRYPIRNLDECLKVTTASRGGIVCTNTGVGWKPTNIQTNLWCGSSVQLSYCTQASAGAVNGWACSFPGDGMGRGNHWQPTQFTGKCRYSGGHSSLAGCTPRLPKP